MINLAIVEDEDHFARELSEYISRYEKETGSVISVTRFCDGDEIVENYTGKYDIILMDIQMKFMDGMTAAEKIREFDKDVVIIFITNMINYAIRGYQVDALDYILKPIEYFPFSQKLERAIGRVKNRETHVLAINTKEGIVKLELDEIFFIESERHNLIYHTRDNDYVTRAKLTDVEESVNGLGFFRSNKGCLVNMRHVDGVKDNCVVIGGVLLPIARARKNDFMSALADYIGDF
ncbi:MAG: LytTR family DNA-binding domain-containing protein [Lachnospiraceae bacterium]|nr:LytTR family DNA-binding domain-containing protein [Lachnospiraceae bacterium]